jgi:hypothetical protein
MPIPENRLQIQGLSEEDYDKVYLAGYQDGIEQAQYVSDHEVAECEVTVNHENQVIYLTWNGEPDRCLVSKEGLKLFLRDTPEGWTYEFTNF